MCKESKIDFTKLIEEIGRVFEIKDYGFSEIVKLQFIEIEDKDWFVKIEEYKGKLRAFVTLKYPNYKLYWMLDPLSGCAIDPNGRPLILESRMGDSIFEIRLWRGSKMVTAGKEGSYGKQVHDSTQ